MSNVPDILEAAAATFRSRNAGYKDGYKTFGDMMVAMFPDGVRLRTPEDFTRWHLFELLMVKVRRFASSGLTHEDSMHDAAVYAAMIESVLEPTSLAIPGGSVSEVDARAIVDAILGDLAKRAWFANAWEDIPQNAKDTIRDIWINKAMGARPESE